MSARVFKPIAFAAEIPKMRTSPSIEATVYKGFAKVRRSLFGAPDVEGSKRFLDEELAKLVGDKCDKWEFDFVTGRPKDVVGRYDWHSVTPPPSTRVGGVGVPFAPAKHKFDGGLQEVCTELLYPPIPSSSSLIIADDETLPEFSRIRIHANIPKKQSLITDFMQTRKRCEQPSLKKKLKRNTPPKPKKLARMFLADSGS